MEKTGFKKNEISDPEIQKIAELFNLLMQVDQRLKKEGVDKDEK